MPAGNSFTVFAERVDPGAGFDGLVAVMNKASVASGKLIAIESIRVMTPSPINSDLTNILGTNGIISLERVTAYFGGTEISAFKYDTNAGSLPAGVKVMLFPDSVTSPIVIRKFGDVVSTYTITKATMGIQAMMRAPGVADANESGRNVESHNVLHRAVDSTLQAITLREGEGLASIQRAFGVPQSEHWSLTIRVIATGKTYRFKIDGCGSTYEPDAPKWVLFNTVGSGVVLEVCVVNFSDMGEENIPRIRITRIGGIDSNPSVTEITPLKHDTSSDFSDIKAYIGEFRVKVLAQTQGVPINYNDYQILPIPIATQQQVDTFRQFSMAEPKYSLTHAPPLRFENECERWPGDRRGVNAIDDEIIIHPGEGIALLAGGNGLIDTSELAYYNIEIIGRFWTDVVTSSTVTSWAY